MTGMPNSWSAIVTVTNVLSMLPLEGGARAWFILTGVSWFINLSLLSHMRHLQQKRIFTIRGDSFLGFRRTIKGALHIISGIHDIGCLTSNNGRSHHAGTAGGDIKLQTLFDHIEDFVYGQTCVFITVNKHENRLKSVLFQFFARF